MKTSSVIGYLGICSALYVLIFISSLQKTENLQIFIYTFAYILAIFAGFLWVYKANSVCEISLFSTSRFGMRMTVFAFPAVFGTVFFASVLSAYLTAKTGGAPAEAPTLSALACLRYGCFVPLAEELFFRYLPLRLCAGDKCRAALVLCVIPFTVFHLGQFRFIYAFVAGILFFAADMAAKSLLPSLLMHMAVNTLALLYPHLTAGAVLPVTAVILLLCIASAVWCVAHKKEITACIRGTCS